MMNTLCSAFRYLFFVTLVAALGGCADEEGALCPAPDESRSWHYRDDTRFTWCASCRHDLSVDEFGAWATALGWEGPLDQVVPCTFTPNGSPDDGAECRRWVCEEGPSEGDSLITIDTPVGAMIQRQRARF